MNPFVRYRDTAIIITRKMAQCHEKQLYTLGVFFHNKS